MIHKNVWWALPLAVLLSSCAMEDDPVEARAQRALRATGDIAIGAAGPWAADATLSSGIDMAVAELNAKGGILGRRIQLIKADEWKDEAFGFILGVVALIFTIIEVTIDWSADDDNQHAKNTVLSFGVIGMVVALIDLGWFIKQWRDERPSNWEIAFTAIDMAVGIAGFGIGVKAYTS